MSEKTITITMPASLAAAVIDLGERFSEVLGSAGCNDYEMRNTPANRALLDAAEASNEGVTVEEYRKGESYQKPHTYKGKIITDDGLLWGHFQHIVQQAIDAS